MARNRTPISKARSYRAISEFWDTHDLGDYWDQTKPVDFEVAVQSEATYFPVETSLCDKIARIARKRGISPETLLNLWLQERIGQEQPAK